MQLARVEVSQVDQNSAARSLGFYGITFGSVEFLDAVLKTNREMFVSGDADAFIEFRALVMESDKGPGFGKGPERLMADKLQAVRKAERHIASAFFRHAVLRNHVFGDEKFYFYLVALVF
ncbi:hypothetical protein DX914_02575 [Lysobacter silvisoli]|uniref:Uncharacterized protein n=1 Tax=Lysobacter silvisoli TaxID=2293254 RepID=A0A371K2G1_9GAMM|nr:hypothetical protein DX914_02575 [Lysobacter silvisoli]